MSQIGETSATINAYPALRSHRLAAGSVNVDRIAVPSNDGGVNAGTDIITAAVKTTTASGASTQEAKRLADYYEWFAERSETTQHWAPA